MTLAGSTPLKNSSHSFVSFGESYFTPSAIRSRTFRSVTWRCSELDFPFVGELPGYIQVKRVENRAADSSRRNSGCTIGSLASGVPSGSFGRSASINSDNFREFIVKTDE